MAKNLKDNFFTCKTCGKFQNIDQSVEFGVKYCVSCYNKDQVHRDMSRKIQKYINILKEQNNYTKIRKKKISDIILLNEMILPQTIFSQEDGVILDLLREKQKEAFKNGLVKVKEKYGFEINESAITWELVNRIKPFWKVKGNPAEKLARSIIAEIEPFMDQAIPKDQHIKFFKDLRKEATISLFTSKKGQFITKPFSPFYFKEAQILETVKTYRKRIEKYSSQIEQFGYLIRYLGRTCQFQTLDDKLKKSIQDYVLEFENPQVEKLIDRMKSTIERSENSKLIPNIARYIRENHERIFSDWYAQILPFDKKRFNTSQAKTGSRTDFIVRLEYLFNAAELKIISQELKNCTELLIRNKFQAKVEKTKANDNFSSDKKKEKISKLQERFEKDLLPENLEEKKEQISAGATMIARFLLLNTEKAFNVVLDRIIRAQYKRLNIKTPVTYITNVLESGARETKRQLSAFYLIQSREW